MPTNHWNAHGACAYCGRENAPENEICPKGDMQIEKCFVATAVYGGEAHPDVEALRLWRDTSLRKRAVGRAFIATYQRVGPHAAGLVRAHDWMRRPCRVMLSPAVAYARRRAG